MPTESIMLEQAKTSMSKAAAQLMEALKVIETGTPGWYQVTKAEMELDTTLTAINAVESFMAQLEAQTAPALEIPDFLRRAG